jgi:WhiB family redox-sensing transcriptional regulator
MTPQWRDWRERAVCWGLDPELFFPVGGGAQATRQAAYAKSVCRSCPVMQRCADVATTHGYEGIWGGLDDEERRWLRRGRAIAPSPATPAPQASTG